jgi:hypothetical protein
VTAARGGRSGVVASAARPIANPARLSE